MLCAHAQLSAPSSLALGWLTAVPATVLRRRVEAMASVIVQPPCYVKLDQQTSRDDRGDERDSPLFSLETDDSLSPGGYRQVSGFRKTSTFLPLHGPARKVRQLYMRRSRLCTNGFALLDQAALPMIAISAVGWMLFVLSFGIYRNRYMLYSS